MNVNLGIWDRLTQVILFLILIALACGVFFWYLPLIQQNERMRKQILELEDRVRREEDQARQLKTAIDALRNDPRTVERLARERLGYARPGETVIRFQEPATNAPPATP
jgi:cell division protein FtsB